MKISQLKYFLSVCNSGNFTQAAKENFVSQPAISQAIRELEEVYGVRLFERTNRGLTLTQEGKWLRERADFIVKYVASTEEQLAILSNNKQYLRVGVAPMVGAISFFNVFDSFTTKHQDIHVDLMEAGSVQIRRWLDENLIDLGFCIVDGLNSDGITVDELYREELVYCVHQSNVLASKSRVSFEEIAQQKIILLKEDSYQNQLVKEEFTKRNLKLNVMMYSGQLNSIFNMLSYGNCGAFLFRRLAERAQDISMIPVENGLTVNIGMIRRNQATYPVVLSFVKYFKKNLH